jgi:hypothetical protein
VLSAEQRQQVMTMVTDFPRLWRDPATPHRERKRIVRVVLEDVTLTKTDEVLAQFRLPLRGNTYAPTSPAQAR